LCEPGGIAARRLLRRTIWILLLPFRVQLFGYPKLREKSN